MDSTLMTSAPQSARCIATMGPAPLCVMPITLMPASGSLAILDNPPFPQFHQVILRVPQGGIDFYVVLSQHRGRLSYLPGQLRTCGRSAGIGQLPHHRMLGLRPEASLLELRVSQQVFGGIDRSAEDTT